MSYPQYKPSSRSYTPGDWAQKKYKAMDGSETRIRYGSKRTDAELRLEYQNIEDGAADDFLAHYDQMFGTYTAFTIPIEVTSGWTGSSYIPNASVMKFRYSGPPQVQSVRPGISTVSIELVGVI